MSSKSPASGGVEQPFELVPDRTNFSVDPKGRIARLPRFLRPPALLLRAVVRPVPKLPYVYEADGLATAHYSPFLRDREWDALYWRAERDWHPQYTADMRWRVWLLTALARRSAGLPGAFAEFGTYRGGCAFMLLSTVDLPSETKLHLFDTFEGIPDSELTEHELNEGFSGRYEDSSAEYVRDLLGEWASQVEIHAGDVFDTLPATETGPLAFAHIDLNASAPTKAALDYAYPRMVPGFTILLDDYGWPDYREQKRVIDEFFEDKPEDVIPLPTGQGLVLGASRHA